AAIKRTSDKFLTEGTCLDLNKGRSGRMRTGRTMENSDLVRQSLEENGQRSTNLLEDEWSWIKPMHVQIVKIDLKFHPYVLIRRQELKEGDPAQRLVFCNRFVDTNPGFHDQLIVSDEAVFSLNSEVNSRKVVKYAEYGAEQVMVWAGLTRAGAVLGLHFVEWNLDSREYLRIIRYHVIQRDFRETNNRRVMWWQQDGAPCHISNATMRYLRRQFPGK
ncbi:Hypothetical predicted protein, partial [Paramuricea clavata]